MQFFLFTFIKLALIQTNVIVDELKKLWPNTSFEIGEFFLFLFHLRLLGSFIFELNQGVISLLTLYMKLTHMASRA